MVWALFSVDAGPQAGLGHLRRCEALAGELQNRNIPCIWMLTDAMAQNLIRQAGMDVIDSQAGQDNLNTASIVVLDHRGKTRCVPGHYLAEDSVRCVIDDLAEHPIVADIVVNPNCYGDTLRYDVSNDCEQLTGPNFSLVASRLITIRDSRDARQNQRIMITFGGTDDGTLGAIVAEKIYGAQIAQPSEIDLVLSPACSPSPSVAPAAAAGVTVHQGAEMATLYSSARVVIGGASVTMAEAAAAGVPSIACRTADDQAPNAAALKRLGLKVIDFFDPNTIAAATAELLSEGSGNPLSGLIDGQGPARIANAIMAKVTQKTVAA